MDDAYISIAGLTDDSIVDGPGLRLTIFAQGCPFDCKGCHNPEARKPNGGKKTPLSDILERIDRNPLLDGVTLSGGEPFMQAAAFCKLCDEIRKRNLGIIIYTGYRWEEITADEKLARLAAKADYIIDGRFEEDSRSLDLSFRGSKNQRFIDVKKTLAAGTVVEHELFSTRS